MFNFPITDQELKQLSENDTNTLILLDKSGLLVGKTESIEEYKQRLINLKKELQSLSKLIFKKEPTKIYKSVILNKDMLIPNEIFRESEQLTEKFSFKINWAPGFFAKKSIGFLTGGFTIISNASLSIFILKSCFKNKIKWLWYNRVELLSHELCHVARAPIADKEYEEFFAYRHSFSKLRKYLGNCFRSPYDSILLLSPFFLLLFMEILKITRLQHLPIFYFWILCFIYPVFLLLRNHFSRSKFFKAKANLLDSISSKNPEAILFRCTSKEISRLAKFAPPDKTSLSKYIKELSNKNLRWKVIYKRFFE